MFIAFGPLPTLYRWIAQAMMEKIDGGTTIKTHDCRSEPQARLIVAVRLWARLGLVAKIASKTPVVFLIQHCEYVLQFYLIREATLIEEQGLFRSIYGNRLALSNKRFSLQDGTLSRPKGSFLKSGTPWDTNVGPSKSPFIHWKSVFVT